MMTKKMLKKNLSEAKTVQDFEAVYKAFLDSLDNAALKQHCLEEFQKMFEQTIGKKIRRIVREEFAKHKV